MNVRRSIVCFALSSSCVGILGLAMEVRAADQPGLARPSGISAPMDRASAQRLFDAWKAPVPPRHLVANIYYVGAIGVSSFLITSPQGHLLLDTGFDDTVPIIQRGVEQLGFKLTDIKFLLSSHAHVDHVGGHARMKQLTGATICASAADARIMASGGTDDFIPFPKDLIVYEPVKADRIINDGDHVELGGVRLTAHLTPGHTRGATTWTMDVTENGHVYHVVFFSSATISPGTSVWRKPPYPELAQDFEKTFAVLKQLPCDIFFAPHGGQFAMAEKFAKLERGESNPFVDPAGWRATIAAQEKIFRDQLAAEKN